MKVNRIHLLLVSLFSCTTHSYAGEASRSFEVTTTVVRGSVVSTADIATANIGTGSQAPAAGAPVAGAVSVKCDKGGVVFVTLDQGRTLAAGLAGGSTPRSNWLAGSRSTAVQIAATAHDPMIFKTQGHLGADAGSAPHTVTVTIIY